MEIKQENFTLLGGRVTIARGRYNPTSDAVWLAAFMGTQHKTILDVGIGTGGAALCALAHNKDAKITGLDKSSEMLSECATNAALNNADIELINADIFLWKTDKTFDAVISNPPYFKGTPAKHDAHHNVDLSLWTQRCLRRVRPGGTFYTIIDAATAAQVISAINNVCGDVNIFPLFGTKNTAERVLISGRIGTRGPTIIHRGLSMNSDAVLRDGLTISAALSTLGNND